MAFGNSLLTRHTHRSTTTSCGAINKLLDNFARLDAFDKATELKLGDDETETTIAVKFSRNRTLSVTVHSSSYRHNGEEITPETTQFSLDDEMALVASALLLALTED